MERSITVQKERGLSFPSFVSSSPIITANPSESSGSGTLLLLEQVPQHSNKRLTSTGRFSQDMLTPARCARNSDSLWAGLYNISGRCVNPRRIIAQGTVTARFRYLSLYSAVRKFLDGAHELSGNGYKSSMVQGNEVFGVSCEVLLGFRLLRCVAMDFSPGTRRSSPHIGGGPALIFLSAPRPLGVQSNICLLTCETSFPSTFPS
jgi:hypothetical protein